MGVPDEWGKQLPGGGSEFKECATETEMSESVEQHSQLALPGKEMLNEKNACDFLDGEGGIQGTGGLGTGEGEGGEEVKEEDGAVASGGGSDRRPFNRTEGGFGFWIPEGGCFRELTEAGRSDGRKLRSNGGDRRNLPPENPTAD